MRARRHVRSGSVASSNDEAGWRARLTEGAVTIVAAYVANNRVPHSELPALVALVGQSLTDAVTSQGQDATSTIRKATESEIRGSIRRDRLISFIDGKPYKALRRHLTCSGYTAEAYRRQFGLPIDYPLVAPSYSERRSAISREIGSRRSTTMPLVTLGNS